MPRTAAATEAAELDETATPSFAQRAAGLIGTVRDHPRTAIATGAVLAAGVAAAIPLAKRRSGANGNGKAPARRRAAPKKKG